MTTMHQPPVLSSRILGPSSPARRELLACIDVVVGYVSARHRFALVGWRIEAALVDARSDFRGGETVALRVTPEHDCLLGDLARVPNGVLREIGSRITAGLEGVANVVPDIACLAPDVDGLFFVADEDEEWELGGAATA